MPRVVLAVGLALLLTACTSAQSRSEATPNTAASASTTEGGPRPPQLASGQATLGGPECRPASPIGQTPDGLAEVHGTGVQESVQLWGLLFKEGPLRSGDEVKIAWRMTGAGDLTLGLTRPDGTPGVLEWGPEPHESSNYNRPGQEWGAGYRLDEPGCWTLHADRADGGRADVWLHVDA